MIMYPQHLTILEFLKFSWMRIKIATIWLFKLNSVLDKYVFEALIRLIYFLD